MVKRKPREFPHFIPEKFEDWLLWGLYVSARSYESIVEGIRRFQCSNHNTILFTAENGNSRWQKITAVIVGIKTT